MPAPGRARQERPPIGEVVDREYSGYVPFYRRLGGEVGGDEPGVPVMTVQDVRAPVRIGAAREFCRDPAEQSEPAMVVGPIAAVWARIWTARAVVEGGMIDKIGEAFGTG